MTNPFRYPHLVIELHFHKLQVVVRRKNLWTNFIPSEEVKMHQVQSSASPKWWDSRRRAENHVRSQVVKDQYDLWTIWEKFAKWMRSSILAVGNAVSANKISSLKSSPNLVHFVSLLRTVSDPTSGIANAVSKLMTVEIFNLLLNRCRDYGDGSLASQVLHNMLRLNLKVCPRIDFTYCSSLHGSRTFFACKHGRMARL